MSKVRPSIQVWNGSLLAFPLNSTTHWAKFDFCKKKNKIMSSFKWIFLKEIVLNTEFSILNYKDSLNFMNHTTVVWGDNKTTNPLKKWTKNSAVMNFFILSPALETVIGSLTKFQSWHDISKRSGHFYDHFYFKQQSSFLPIFSTFEANWNFVERYFDIFLHSLDNFFYVFPSFYRSEIGWSERYYKLKISFGI